MTNQEAKRILHPNTTAEAISEIEYYSGFNGKEARIKAIEEACLVACEALGKQIPKEAELLDNLYDEHEIVLAAGV